MRRINSIQLNVINNRYNCISMQFFSKIVCQLQTMLDDDRLFLPVSLHDISNEDNNNHRTIYQVP